MAASPQRTAADWHSRRRQSRTYLLIPTAVAPLLAGRIRPPSDCLLLNCTTKQGGIANNSLYLCSEWIERQGGSSDRHRRSDSVSSGRPCCRHEYRRKLLRLAFHSTLEILVAKLASLATAGELAAGQRADFGELAETSDSSDCPRKWKVARRQKSGLPCVADRAKNQVAIIHIVPRHEIVVKDGRAGG